jgi:GINS complex subunit 4
MLAQTEVERVKFIVRSYVRTRLFKVNFHLPCDSKVIKLYSGTLLGREICSIYNHQCRCSETFDGGRARPCKQVLLVLCYMHSFADSAHRQARMIDQHLFTTVLQSLPPAQAHLDDTPVFVPSMSAFFACRYCL